MLLNMLLVAWCNFVRASSIYPSEECALCISAEPIFYFSPCNHLCICKSKQCLKQARRLANGCPICRAEFSEIRKYTDKLVSVEEILERGRVKRATLDTVMKNVQDLFEIKMNDPIIIRAFRENCKEVLEKNQYSEADATFHGVHFMLSLLAGFRARTSEEILTARTSKSRELALKEQQIIRDRLLEDALLRLETFAHNCVLSLKENHGFDLRKKWLQVRRKEVINYMKTFDNTWYQKHGFVHERCRDPMNRVVEACGKEVQIYEEAIKELIADARLQNQRCPDSLEETSP